MTKLYCANCGKHTDHIVMLQIYATACTKCKAHTSSLMRLQAEQATTDQLAAPDGTPATIVENTPQTVTYYIDSGAYKGYYDYDKQTKAKQIRQG